MTLPFHEVPSRGLDLGELHRALEAASIPLHGLDERNGVIRVTLKEGARQTDLDDAVAILNSATVPSKEVLRAKALLENVLTRIQAMEREGVIFEQELIDLRRQRLALVDTIQRGLR